MRNSVLDTYVSVIALSLTSFVLAVSQPTLLSSQPSWKKAAIVEDKEGSRFFRTLSINESGVGVAVGYRAVGQLPVIFCTSDYGRHWRFAYQRSHLQKPLLSPVDTRGSIAILSADSFMVLCDNALMLRSSDGGYSWSEQKIDSIPSDLSAAWLKMFNAREGVLVYNSWTVWETSDAGLHWSMRTQSALPFDTLQHSRIRDIHCFDTLHWYVCSDNIDRAKSRCMMHETTDGGRTWMRSSAIPSPRLTPYGAWAAMLDCLNFVDEQHGWIVATCPLNTVDNRQRDIILATTDAGLSWTTQLDTTFISNDSPVAFGLQSVAALNRDTVYACGNAKLLCSTNGGQSWKAQSIESNSSSVHVEAYELFVRPWARVMCTSGLANPTADLYYFGDDTQSGVEEADRAVANEPTLSIVSSSDILLRSLRGRTEVELWSCAGQLMRRASTNAEDFTLSCPELSQGFYLLQYTSTLASGERHDALKRILIVR